MRPTTLRPLVLALSLVPVALAAPRLLALPAVSDAGAQRPREASTALEPDSPYRQFDFWVGEWECFDTKGQKSGENTITRECGGYALRESWVGAGGGKGTSLNAWDRSSELWRQTWVDSSGLVLQLAGGLLEDGGMLLEGVRPATDGAEVRHRVLWRPRTDGTVQQTWESSTDGGARWQVVADLTYRHKAAEADGESTGKRPGADGDQPR